MKLSHDECDECGCPQQMTIWEGPGERKAIAVFCDEHAQQFNKSSYKRRHVIIARHMAMRAAKKARKR